MLILVLVLNYHEISIQTTMHCMKCCNVLTLLLYVFSARSPKRTKTTSQMTSGYNSTCVNYVLAVYNIINCLP